MDKMIGEFFFPTVLTAMRMDISPRIAVRYNVSRAVDGRTAMR